MYYLCEKYYKPITVQYYIADCVSWVPRLTVGITNKVDFRKHSCNGIHSYGGDLMYFFKHLKVHYFIKIPQINVKFSPEITLPQDY